MCSIKMHKNHAEFSAAPHALAQLRILARRIVQRLFTLQSSGHTKQVETTSNEAAAAKEIAENEANERLQAAGAIITPPAPDAEPPRVLCLETNAGCFFWETNVLKSAPAADLDWCTVSCSFYPAMQQFH